MTQKKTSILIVGGGTSGWITAAMLRQAFGKNVKISLIESEDIGIIGVGESTVPTIRAILQTLGLEEDDFMRHCHSTFKVGLKFVNWKKPTDGRPHQYYHSFGPISQRGGINLSEYWLRLHRSGEGQAFDYSCYMNPWIADQKKAPKFSDTATFEGIVDYTYHVDAKLFAQYLREIAIKRGVRHYVGDVVEVRQNEEGEIEKLVTRPFGDLKADLYIDCSGFRGLLINQTLKEPFLYYSKSLLCDQAVATQAPRPPEETQINPYTTAHALSSGWVWNIPLQTRDGTGYVYSSSFLSAEKAEEEFRAFLGERAKDLSVFHLKMRIGRNQRAWVKNCVSIGLSCGFIEPLESSGIGFIYIAVNELIPLIEKYRSKPELTDRFNRTVADLYDMIRDFIIIHYCLTDRDETPFWRANQYELQIPERLKSHLEGWKEHFPQDHVKSGLVSLYNYKITHILAGMGYLPRACRKEIAAMGLNQIRNIFEMMRQRAQKFAKDLPDHGEYLRSRQA